METETRRLAVRLKFMGEMAAIVGQRTLEIDLPEASTVADLLAHLAGEYGEDFRVKVFSGPAKLHHTMLIFVDGEDIKRRGGLGATLGNGNVEVIMLPMYAGG